MVMVVVLGALAWGAYGRWQQRAATIGAQQSTADFVPEVRVALAMGQDGPVVLTLPGTVLPFGQARIFARATGYVAERHVDIGTRVAKGDLLLRIAAPDESRDESRICRDYAFTSKYAHGFPLIRGGL
jgi:multidrug efflux pump subunit AcrA (membrane-fusion protein)